MADYYAILTQKIKESSDDPAKLRQVVYEAARLALRWQVEQQWPRFSIDKSKRHISELEDAISRLEAVAAGAGGAPVPESNEAAASLKASQQRRDEPIESDTVKEWHPQNPLSAEEAGLAAVARSLSERDNRVPSSAAGLKAGRQSGEVLIEPEVECAPPTFEAPIPQPRHPPSAEREWREVVAGSLSGSNREPKNATASLNASGESRNALGEFETDDAPDAAERLSKASPPSREEDDVSYSREKPHPQSPDPPPTEVTSPDAVGDGLGRKAAAGFRASRQKHYAPVQSEEDDAPDTDEESNSYPWHSPAAELPDQSGSRELVFVPGHAKRPTYLVNPHDFVNPDVTYRIAPAPRSRARKVVLGLMIAFQLPIATLAVAAFYVAMWGRNNLVQTAREMPSPAELPPSARPAAAPDGTVAAASLAAPPIAATPPFALPTTYGVYAIRNNQLIELERVEATPVDPRIRTQLQIVKPVRVVIDAETPAFVVFRRDLISSAPDKVPVRIAARVAHSMIFDAEGKPSVTTPAIHTWLIRDQGYNLRVSPLRESAEMVMLRPEDPELSFSSGRYELMFGGQAYDFLVAGEVTDPAHCVEGVATPRGPVFYECKAPR